MPTSIDDHDHDDELARILAELDEIRAKRRELKARVAELEAQAADPYSDAVTREDVRERCARILESPAGLLRPRLAKELALRTTLPPEAAEAVLAAAPTEPV